MRIGIDARLFGTHARGIGRYISELIKHLEKNSSKHEYIIFLNPQGDRSWKPRTAQWKKVVVDIPWYSFREQYTFSKIIKREHIDCMHFPHYNVPVIFRGRYIVTIHDVLLHRYPHSNASTKNPIIFYIKYIAYRFVFWHTVRHAEAIIAVSHFTKKEILTYYPNLKNVAVITEGVNTVSGEPLQTPTKNQLLYVGAAYPHKNLQNTIRVIHATLKKFKSSLVLVGRNDYFYESLKQWTFENNYTNVTFRGEVSDQELSVLYKESKALIYPSVYEGFGLPPLEALVLGCPVIAYASHAVRETAGQYVSLYETEDELRTLTIKALSNQKIEVAKHSIEEIKKRNSWEDMAKKTESLYTGVHGE